MKNHSVYLANKLSEHIPEDATWLLAIYPLGDYTALLNIGAPQERVVEFLRHAADSLERHPDGIKPKANG